ncbi:MAG: hypothetical protein AAF703_00155 [Cyanobacteria bacterium P01_D01_bin.105]
MVSSLKLWQHPQPKRLWPILSGLSVLAHIGILGLSLPYIMELIESEGSSASSSAIPIEFVVINPDNLAETSSRKATTISPSPQPTQSTSASPSTSTPASSGSAASEPQAASSNNATTFANSAGNRNTGNRNTGNRNTDTRNTDTNSAERSSTTDTPTEPPTIDNPKPAEPAVTPENPAQNGSGNTNGNTRPPGNPAQQPSREEPLPQKTPVEPSAPDVPESDAPESDNLSATNSSEADGELPTLPSDQSLPTPEDEAASRNSNAPQSAFLSIVGFSEAPGQQDVGKTPPRPKEGITSDGILLDPAAKGCPRLTFSQEQWRYLVSVNTDGSVRQATVWTNRISRAMSEEEEAIACLIEKAGFEFEPALFDGQPILDDNLLLTIRLVEMLP